MTPVEQYLDLMGTVRDRLDLIQGQKQATAKPFLKAETAAFHGRKVIEAIAFGCLTALENGIKVVPNDAKGQWNAETIFKNLKAKGFDVLPSPSRIRNATLEELSQSGVKVVVEGIPERRLSHDELIGIYKRLHSWLHEANPYVHDKQDTFYEKRGPALWADLEKISSFMSEHFISIKGQGFFCVLRDKIDGHTKVLPLTKVAALSRR